MNESIREKIDTFENNFHRMEIEEKKLIHIQVDYISFNNFAQFAVFKQNLRSFLF
jgi:hypothetical protein